MPRTPENNTDPSVRNQRHIGESTPFSRCTDKEARANDGYSAHAETKSSKAYQFPFYLIHCANVIEPFLAIAAPVEIVDEYEWHGKRITKEEGIS